MLTAIRLTAVALALSVGMLAPAYPADKNAPKNTTGQKSSPSKSTGSQGKSVASSEHGSIKGTINGGGDFVQNKNKNKKCSTTDRTC